jgi:hypothetical protein
MSRATLVFDADTTAIARAIAGIPGMVRTAQSQITGIEKAGATERAGVAQGEQRRKSSAEQEAVRAKRRAEREKSQAEKSASRERSAMAANETRERIAKMRAETEQRTQLALAAMAASERAERAATAAHAREERSRTDTTKREERVRTRAIAEGRRRQQPSAGPQRPGGMGQQSRLAGGMRAVASAAWSAATSEHADIQDVRRRRAAIDDTLGGAVTLAGGDQTEQSTRANQLHEFAERNHLSSEAMAQAAEVGQAEFNVLGDRTMNRDQRDHSFQSFMQDFAEGADTGADPTQHVRLSGMMRANGFDDATRRQALSVIGAATQAGAVEEGDLTRGGMAAMLARMRGARAGVGETQQAAQLRELTQTIAEMEIAKQGGMSVQRSGNIMRHLERLRGGHAADLLLNNINHGNETAGLSQEQRDRARSTLFEADPTRSGQMRLRQQYQSGIGLAEGISAAGLSAEQFSSLFAGGGHGNAQGLRQNERDALSSLMMENAQGTTGLRGIEAMRNAGGLTPDDLTRMKGNRYGRESSLLTWQEEHRMNDLSGSHETGLSNRVADWQTEHPFLAPLASGFTGLASSVAGWMGMRALQGYSASAVVGAETTSAATSAAAPGATSLLGGAGSMLIAPVAAAAAVLLHTQSSKGAQDQANWETNMVRNAHAQGRAVDVSLTAESAALLADAIRRAPITATVTPHDAAHAASNAHPVHP